MSVAFIGDFMYQAPEDYVIGSFDLLLAYLKIHDYVSANFTLYALCELRPTDSPGTYLYNRLDTICNSSQIMKNTYQHICQHLVT